MESTNTPTQPSSTGKMIAIGLVVVAIIGIVIYSTNRPTVPPNTQPPAQQQPTAAQPTDDMGTTTMEAAEYQDGTYTAEGAYVSPGGPESIGVTLTLENGVVTAAEVETGSERPASQKFQDEFAQNFEPLVVGKNITELALDKVAGSSLTPKGFNDAVEKIKADAQAS